MSIFRSCPMKWKWHYIDNLVPKRIEPQLTLGLVVHKAFERHYGGATLPEILTYISGTYKDHISNAHPEDVERLTLDHKTALGMWVNYPSKHLNFDEIRSEEKFSERIDDVRGIRFVGRIDGLVKQNNSWWIREVKVTGSGLRPFEGRAQTSPQATGYVYAMKRKTGYPIEGIVFDAIRRPLLRKRVDEDTDEFAQRIYNDYCDPSKSKSYFKRLYAYRSPVDLKHYEEDTAKVARKIRKAMRHETFYRNQDQCWAFNKECPYKKICFAETPDPLVLSLYYKERR